MNKSNILLLLTNTIELPLPTFRSLQCSIGPRKYVQSVPLINHQRQFSSKYISSLKFDHIHVSQADRCTVLHRVHSKIVYPCCNNTVRTMANRVVPSATNSDDVNEGKMRMMNGSVNQSSLQSTTHFAYENSGMDVEVENRGTKITEQHDNVGLGIEGHVSGRKCPANGVRAWQPPLLSLQADNEVPNKSGSNIMAPFLGGWRNIQKLRTLPRDLRALKRYISLLYRIRRLRNRDASVPQVFDETTAKHHNKVAFYFENQEWTFAEVQNYSCRIANIFRSKLKKGDSVALLMENRIEFICVWLGLSRLGVVPALLNHNLRHKSLAHCINVAECKIVICGSELQSAINDIKDSIIDIPVYVSGTSQDGSDISVADGINLDGLLTSANCSIPVEQDEVKFGDKLVYIYTSGTTGLPKAAIINHSRFMFASIGMLSIVGVDTSDVVYTPLPLYHSAGGMIGVGMTFTDGVTLAIRKKFSVSNYFLDCKRYGCTVSQYIGEICRYLLNSPESDHDKQHKVRVMFGNGLRPQIWEEFQRRFNIPRISEFYGSTEGNANIINMDGKVGAVGFLSVLIPSVYPCALIRIDADSGKPIRDANGICVKCKPGEPGEFVGKIVANDPVREFTGYADKKASNKKIVNDVFRKGDSAFLSGDLLVMDEEGYLYFKDRTGDTFRWKGENVSTAEVENHLCGIVDCTDIAVYGVEVPQTEGRAGMVAVLDPDESLDVNKLARGVINLLPSYARPMFLRTVKQMDLTGTYKLKKTDLQKEGFDVTVLKDPVYILDTKAPTYKPLDQDTYNKLMNGDIRL